MLLRILPLLLMALTAGASDGSMDASTGMAAQLTCQAYTLGSGNLALMAGFLVAVYGLYQMIINAGYKSGLVLIISGALLTALPGIIINFFKGTSTFLYQQGLTDGDYSGAMDYAISFAGNCDAIPVDFSAYDNQSADFWEAAHGKPGDPDYRPGGAGARGAPAIKQAQLVKGEMIKGPMDMSNMSCSEGANSSIAAVLGDNTGRITSCFKTGRTCSGCSRNHGALDMVATSVRQPPITAAMGGTVTFAGYVGGYGNRVHVDHGGYKSSYSHMAGITVSLGDPVQAKGRVGTMGNTGGSYPVHLHYEVHQGGQKVNPCGKLNISC